jgi:GNAT superfamily N-acetyltransferase
VNIGGGGVMTGMTSSVPDPAIRPMRETDIAAGVSLVGASRWNQTEREWRLFLEIAPRGAIVAERAGRVVGTAVTVTYAPDVAWIAMVLVEPEARGQGIGRALLRHAVANAPEGFVPRLDATPAGRALYLGLGFDDEDRLSRWRSASGLAASAGADVRPLDDGDWPALLAADREAAGFDRARVLAWCREGAPDLAWVSARGVAGGYVLGRRGRETDHVGPVVAASPGEASALVEACLSRVTRAGVSIDVPDAQHDLARWLRARGFEVERPFTRMRRGGAGGRPLSPRVFASVGPEFG